MLTACLLGRRGAFERRFLPVRLPSFSALDHDDRDVAVLAPLRVVRLRVYRHHLHLQQRRVLADTCVLEVAVSIEHALCEPGLCPIRIDPPPLVSNL